MKFCKTILIIFFVVTFFSYNGFSQTTGAFSQSTIDWLKKLIQEDKEDTDKVYHIVAVSNAYLPLSGDTSVLYAQEALDLAQKINFIPGIFFAQQNLVNGLRVSGNYPLALDNAFKYLSFSNKVIDTLNICIANALLGDCYYDIADYDASLKYYRENLRTAAHMYGVYYAWANMSRVYHILHQADSAMFYAKKAYKRITNWNDTLFVSNILGDAFFDKANYDSALFQYKVTMLVAIAQNDKVDKVNAYNGIAAVYRISNHLDSAAWYCKKVVAENISKSYPLGLLKAVNMLTDIYGLQDISDSSLRYLRIAISIKDSLFSREKTLAIQNLAYKEQEKEKEIAASKLKYQNRLRMYSLLVGLIALLIIAVILLRNNRHKQKAYTLLQSQKQETDTEKSKAEKALLELKSTQAQLVQSEKMASLGELTAGIAHEIQNPLNFVNNFSEVSTELIDEMNIELDKGDIKEAKEIASDLKQNLEKINHHGKRAGDIVKGMLQHSQKSTGQKEPADINKLADEYLRLSYQGLRAKDKDFNATMKTDFDDSIGKINIIPQDIGRVLLNLYNNAFYAVNQQKSENLISYEPTVSVTTKKTETHVIITVSDNGIGIPQNIVDKIFQPFFTTKPTGQGTGLGLSLSYDIIKVHGGEIKVETKEGEGSTFIFQLL